MNPQHESQLPSQERYARIFIFIGRLLLTLAFFSLVGAWISQATGKNYFGMSQQHAFNDSMSLSLIGIGSLLGGVAPCKGTLVPTLGSRIESSDDDRDAHREPGHDRNGGRDASMANVRFQ